MASSGRSIRTQYGPSYQFDNLRDYLLFPSPHLSHSDSYNDRARGNSRVRGEEPLETREWHGFPFDGMDRQTIDLVESMLDKRRSPSELIDYSDIDAVPFCRIFDEDSLEALLIRWNNAVVSRALKVAQPDRSPQWPFRTIYMARGGQAKLALVRHAEDTVKTVGKYPDWAGIQRTGRDRIGTGQYQNILPGDTKLGVKWTSDFLSDYSTQSSDKRAPIKQVYNYCVKGGSRYGYVISDVELVALRVDRATRTLEWFAVPWDGPIRTPSGTIVTMNLALWYLHMIAALETAPRELASAQPGSRQRSTQSPDSQASTSTYHDVSPYRETRDPRYSSSGRTPRHYRS